MASSTNPDTGPTSGEQSTVTRDSNTALHCRLLALPGEIRNLIWEYTLADNVVRPTVRPELLSFEFSDYDEDGGIVMARRCGESVLQNRFSLIRVCRQIHMEAASLVWSLNTFRFGSSFGLALFVRTTSTAKLQLIRRVEHGDPWCLGVHAERWENNLSYLPSLEEFRIVICSKRVLDAGVMESKKLFGEFKENLNGRAIDMQMVVLPKDKVWIDIYKYQPDWKFD